MKLLLLLVFMAGTATASELRDYELKNYVPRFKIARVNIVKICDDLNPNKFSDMSREYEFAYYANCWKVVRSKELTKWLKGLKEETERIPLAEPIDDEALLEETLLEETLEALEALLERELPEPAELIEIEEMRAMRRCALLERELAEPIEIEEVRAMRRCALLERSKKR